MKCATHLPGHAAQHLAQGWLHPFVDIVTERSNAFQALTHQPRLETEPRSLLPVCLRRVARFRPTSAGLNTVANGRKGWEPSTYCGKCQ